MWPGAGSIEDRSIDPGHRPPTRPHPIQPNKPPPIHHKQVEYDADCGGLDRDVARGVLTPGALAFVAELVHEFRDGVAEVGGRLRD